MKNAASCQARNWLIYGLKSEIGGLVCRYNAKKSTNTLVDYVYTLAS